MDIFIGIWIIGMPCQANGGGSSTLVIFAGWSIIFLLVDVSKALPQIQNYSNPSPHPQIRHFFLLCSQRILLRDISLCALDPPEQRPLLTHGVARHSPLKSVLFFPPTDASRDLPGWQLVATWCFFVGTCTRFDPVPALMGL